ncbi:MAG: hypothetical protein IKI54_05405 [Lachnospiraceae bacterium]|nr:hypothetical protein [Lachnospiraceae bacterium]
MANNQKNVKRDGSKKGGGGKTVAAVAIAALLLGGGGYYGLSGDGMGFLPNHSGVVDPGSPDVITTAEPASDVTTKSEQDEKEISIRIQENELYYRGETVSLEAFEEKILKDYKDGMTITLQDDHAVKASYDAVKAVLDRLGYPYQEK